jgi:hypothetical protein
MRARIPRPLPVILFATAVFLPLLQARTKPVLPDPVAKIFKKNCLSAGCHSGRFPAINLSLDPDKLFAGAVDKPSTENPALKIIDRANPEKSYLLAKVAGAPSIQGKRMPLDKDPLPEADLKLLREWILGLKGTPPDDDTDSDQKPNVAHASSKPPFWGLSLVNLPTTKTLDKGRFLFRISHRYYPSITAGGGSFFGLDGPSIVLIGFGYGVSDRLTVEAGRTNAFDEFALGVHWALADQGRLPFAAALHIGGALATEEVFGRDGWDSRNLKLNLQLSLVRQMTDRLSLALVPSFATHADHWAEEPDSVLALGMGGRMMIFNDVSVIGEWVPVLSGAKAAASGWGLGVEKKIGGHVFQFFVLNSTGLTPDLYLPGGDLRLADGDLRIGFNIYRTF